MRLLHTADWHLGDRLGRIDRTEDLRRAVERIAELSSDERIDARIVAGDLFSELARPDGLRDAVLHLRDTFDGFLRAGGTILAVTGNHDNETFCQTLRHAMNLAAPPPGDRRRPAQPGRLYLAAEPTLLRLADRTGEFAVQFALMPFPTPTVFLSGDAARQYESLGDKNSRLRAAFLDRLADLRRDPHFRHDEPSVLVAHVGVQGAELNSRFRISETEDVVVDPASWPGQFAYVALGHIHKAHAVGGCATVRYSGSIERLDLGESGDEKSVTLVDLDASGRARIETRAIEATPIYRVEVTDPLAELPDLPRRYPDHESALVNLRFSYDARRDNLLDLQRRFDAAFPRWYARDFYNRNDGPAFALPESSTARHFDAVVLEYLRDQLVHESDEEQRALFTLAEQYLHSIDH